MTRQVQELIAMFFPSAPDLDSLPEITVNAPGKKSKSIKLGAHTAASVGIRSDDRTPRCVLPRSHHQPRPRLARPMETSIVCCPNGLQTFSRRRNGFHEAKSDPSKRLLATDTVAVGDRDHCLPRNGRLRRWQTAWCTNFGAETHRCEF